MINSSLSFSLVVVRSLMDSSGWSGRQRDSLSSYEVSHCYFHLLLCFIFVAKFADYLNRGWLLKILGSLGL